MRGWRVKVAALKATRQSSAALLSILFIRLCSIDFFANIILDWSFIGYLTFYSFYIRLREKALHCKYGFAVTVN